ncbi:MAG: hypothetical protein ACON35_04735 [Candidatus Marinamargulisbacteria bacterium]
MIKTLIIGIALCSQLWGFQPYLLYSNAIQTPFLNLDAGAGTSISYGPIVLNLSASYFSLKTHGTIHEPITNQTTLKKDLLNTALSVGYRQPFFPRLNIISAIGYRYFFLLSDSPDDVQIIESKTSAVSIPLIQNYKEEHIPNIFYELGLEFSLNHQVKLIIKKTWQKLRNKISYKYLSIYEETTINELDYEPISISIYYHF